MEVSVLPVAPPTESDDAQLFRRQESTLVALSLTAVVLVHLGFRGTVGVPNSRVLIGPTNGSAAFRFPIG